jgi:hypothetical protein
MKRKTFLLFSFYLVAFGCVQSQITDPKATEVWEPVPRLVESKANHLPPSDAIVLFNGSDLSQWAHRNGDPVKWKLEDGAMTVVGGTGSIFSKEKFGDCQLHLEWRTPSVVVGEDQGRGNSGVFLQNRYEVQVLDNYNNKTYSNGQAGSIYKQSIPLVNACRAPGEWQTYDIIYKAPVFNEDGIKVSSAYITVLHNGVLIQNHTEIKGTSEYIGLPKNIAHGEDSIQLQDHSNPVSYRNIWVRRL